MFDPIVKVGIVRPVSLPPEGRKVFVTECLYIGKTQTLPLEKEWFAARISIQV